MGFMSCSTAVMLEKKIRPELQTRLKKVLAHFDAISIPIHVEKIAFGQKICRIVVYHNMMIYNHYTYLVCAPLP